MSATTSPGTGRVYGVERVCAIWGVPRSSFYAEQQRKLTEPARPTARRRGPKPKISDEDLLAAILADLEASPFEGEDTERSGLGCGCSRAFGCRGPGFGF